MQTADVAMDDWITADSVEGLVSIVIPTCNRSALLAETLDSIFRQDYRPIQVVIADDGSTDNTEEVVSEIQARKLPDIELLYRKQAKSGAPAARNQGALNTTGEFIVFMDDDDVFGSRFVSASVAALRAHPKANMSYCRWQRFLRDDTHYVMLNKKIGFPPNAESPWEAFLVGWTLLLQSCMIRRAYVRDTGAWRLDLLKSQDLDYKARLVAGDCRVVDALDAAVFYRVHDASITGQLDAAKLESYMEVLDSIEATATARDDYSRVRTAVADFLWGHSYWLYSTGILKEALATLRRAKRHDPSVGIRRGHPLSRAMSRIGVGDIAGSLLYQLFKLRNALFGRPKPKITERLDTLPDYVDD